jgi:hypothetical protein
MVEGLGLRVEGQTPRGFAPADELRGTPSQTGASSVNAGHVPASPQSGTMLTAGGRIGKPMNSPDTEPTAGWLSRGFRMFHI